MDLLLQRAHLVFKHFLSIVHLLNSFGLDLIVGLKINVHSLDVFISGLKSVEFFDFSFKGLVLESQLRNFFSVVLNLKF